MVRFHIRTDGLPASPEVQRDHGGVVVVMNMRGIGREEILMLDLDDEERSEALELWCDDGCKRKFELRADGSVLMGRA